MAVLTVLSEHMQAQQEGKLVNVSGGVSSKVKGVSVEITEAADDGSTVDFFRIGSNAILLWGSRLRHEALGGGTMDLGLYHQLLPNGGQPDAILSAVALTSANINGTAFGPPIEDFDRRLWEYVEGLEEDPCTTFIIRGSIAGGTTTPGVVQLELYYMDG